MVYSNFEYSLINDIFKCADCSKDLGIFVDTKLSFNLH